MLRDSNRLVREREHGRRIAPRAEKCWGWSGPAGERRVARRIRLAVQNLAGAPGPWLEIGCGTGVFTRNMAGAPFRMAIDLSFDLLRQAQSSGHGVAFAQADAHHLPFPDGGFGAIYGVSVLHHLRCRQALAEFLRVLRPGGAMFLTEPNILNPIAFVLKTCPPLKQWVGDVPHETAFLRGWLARDLRDAGFRDVEVRPFDFLLPLVPKGAAPVLAATGRMLERLPVFREIAGSLLVTARKPAASGKTPPNPSKKRKSRLKIPSPAILFRTDTDDPLPYYYKPYTRWFYRRRLEMVFSHLSGRADAYERLLEIGFGSGILFFEAARRAKRLSGIDTHAQVDEVGRILAAQGIPADLRQASIYEIPFPAESHDAVLAASVLEHLTDLDGACAEVARVLKPGGVFAVGFPTRNWVSTLLIRSLGYHSAHIHPSGHDEILAALGRRFEVRRVRRLAGLYVAVQCIRRAP